MISNKIAISSLKYLSLSISLSKSSINKIASNFLSSPLNNVLRMLLTAISLSSSKADFLILTGNKASLVAISLIFLTNSLAVNLKALFNS